MWTRQSTAIEDWNDPVLHSFEKFSYWNVRLWVVNVRYRLLMPGFLFGVLKSDDLVTLPCVCPSARIQCYVIICSPLFPSYATVPCQLLNCRCVCDWGACQWINEVHCVKYKFFWWVVPCFNWWLLAIFNKFMLISNPLGENFPKFPTHPRSWLLYLAYLGPFITRWSSLRSLKIRPIIPKAWGQWVLFLKNHLLLVPQSRYKVLCLAS